jgi:hypothetical protein
VIIKFLFAILVLSSVALVGVAIAAFVRVRWQLKARRAQAHIAMEIAQESNQKGTP